MTISNNSKMSIPKHRYLVSWIVAIAMFMETLDITIIAVAIPTMAADFNVNPLNLKLALTAYLLSLAVFIPISGWVADKWGTKRIFITAIGLFTLGSLACALSQHLMPLVMARLLQGLGGAMMLPVGRIVVLKSFPKSELIRATNNMIMPALIGPALGPLLGGAIVHFVSWRWIFIVNIPMGFVGMWLARRYMVNYCEDNVPKLDWVGFLLLGMGLVCFSLFLQSISDTAIGASLMMTFLVAACLLLTCYVLWSAKRSNPILAIKLFKIKTFAKGISGSLLSRMTISAMPFLLPLLFQIGFGWSPLVSGLLVAPQALGMITGKSLVGYSLRHLGFKNSLIINSFIMALFVISFSFIQPNTPYWLIAAQVYLFGVTVSTQFTGVNLLCYSELPKSDISQATSFNSTVQQYSGSLSIAVASIFVSYFAGTSLQTNKLPAMSLSHTFLVMVGFLFIAELLFFTLKKTDGQGIG